MKYVVIVGDGMSDRPVAELSGSTPLAVARKPNMDRIACEGISGLVSTVPKDMTPGTEVCMMAIMSYDPSKHFTGRGPLEALGRGVEMKKSEVAFRCNLVTVKGAVLEDYSAGHISDVEARPLVAMLDKRMGGDEIRFLPGSSYRHLMIWRGGSEEVKTVAPHDIMGSEFAAHLPAGRGEKKLEQLIRDSRILLEGHEVNRARRAKGLKSANMIWLWSPGRTPSIVPFNEKYGVVGGVISAVDVVKGIGAAAGLEILKVPGVTGYFDTDYGAKGEAAVKFLKRADFVLVHVEAPDEAGHEALAAEKVKAIEQIDEKIVGPVLNAEAKLGGITVLLLPDHATPLAVKTHTADPVPFALYRTGGKPDGVERFDEAAAAAGSVRLEEGWKLLDLVFNRPGSS